MIMFVQLWRNEELIEHTVAATVLVLIYYLFAAVNSKTYFQILTAVRFDNILKELSEFID